MQSSAIFPLFYLPPVSYFSALKIHENNFLIEKQEHFPKQTYRNRAKISSPNGTLDLYVPVVKGSKFHTVIKDVKISYDFKWQRLHWLSLESCYRNSAYFEYYEDEFAQFYTKKYTYLFDYNLEIFYWLLKNLKKNIPVDFTTEYIKTLEPGMDYRDKLPFKDTPEMGLIKPYFQVFEDRNGFTPNLSVVDLLFSQGPQAKLYL
ncbi:WbqC family protein [Pedobacter sp. MC2016-14]|uniref:WbqC family protein n=1 Tax=Pedobacter sp. MC2016-14 TaxID=2897327 RepID=UPI001E592A5C|nr:WbqC family protein [Pedobacter sp. MC2016-14]MCD0490008.1 WbqC family protein [Pedobacter sp. MC2016-14]